MFSIPFEGRAAATFVGSSITHAWWGDAKVHSRMLPVAPIKLTRLLIGAGQADLETFDLAEPAFRLGFGDSGDQVVTDLGKPCPFGRVRSEERASDAPLAESSAEIPQFREQTASTVRSYGMDLLRWWRFLEAVRIPWERATRVEARDFGRWIQLTVKPRRVQASGKRSARVAGAPNPVTGKPSTGPGYAATTIAHSETDLRRFYDVHRDAGAGTLLNPFPLDLSRRSGRAHAHHNPMDSWKPERVVRYRPSLPQRIPRSIPDKWFNELFATPPSNRDRALVAFWISTGVRASELIGIRQCDVDPGRQLISVVRKGSRAMQQMPTSADAFVWLRLCQQEVYRKVPTGRRQPLWRWLREYGHSLSCDTRLRPQGCQTAVTRIATLLACWGGLISDITVGDCVELVDVQRQVHVRGGQKKGGFHSMSREA
ncbi:hypothetical protein ACFVH0_00565 [Streptomyces sp. NPDC127117]|uniref:hypothetical protein n=1 Tax=Streptomyces sp. NPDC127117 TaxID=3345368 RepID=UPI0036266325